MGIERENTKNPRLDQLCYDIENSHVLTNMKGRITITLRSNIKAEREGAVPQVNRVQRLPAVDGELLSDISASTCDKC